MGRNINEEVFHLKKILTKALGTISLWTIKPEYLFTKRIEDQKIQILGGQNSTNDHLSRKYPKKTFKIREGRLVAVNLENDSWAPWIYLSFCKFNKKRPKCSKHFCIGVMWHVTLFSLKFF